LIVPESLKTKKTAKNFQNRTKKFLFLKSYKPLFIFANNRFSKFDPNSDRDGFMCQSWAKIIKFIPLSLRLAKSSLA
jgi:hypothetical protein